MPEIEINEIGTSRVRVPVKGLSPLIIHKFAEKARAEMLAKQQGKSAPKTARDPQAEYEAAFYHMDDGGYGLPVVAFKAAMVGAARYYGKDVKMTELRQFVFMPGEWSEREGQALARIEGEPKMREDVVRLSGPSRTAEIRFRPEFKEWSTTLVVVFVRSCINLTSVLSLINAGGLGVGVGEWRPEKRGQAGTFTVLGGEVEIIN